MSSRQILVLIALVVGCSVVPTANGLIENYEEKWNMTIQQMTSPPSSGDVSAKALSCQGIQFNTSDGTCKLEPRPAATSAHLLTPADIGVVAAIGDSITVSSLALTYVYIYMLGSCITDGKACECCPIHLVGSSQAKDMYEVMCEVLQNC
jgi:hypothetical protein